MPSRFDAERARTSRMPRRSASSFTRRAWSSTGTASHSRQARQSRPADVVEQISPSSFAIVAKSIPQPRFASRALSNALMRP